MDQIFLKSLADVVKISRTTSTYDQLTYTTQLVAEVKNELQSKNENVKIQALLKLLFLAMEGNSVKWAEFQVINLMGSQEFQIKQPAFLAAHLVIDYQSQGLIMVTNLFKKELKNNQIECSAALSCIGAIANKDLSEALLEQVLILTTNSKPIIRKKAMAVLTKIFTITPHNIPNSLDKVLSALKKETNTAVLASGMSLISQVLKVAPSIYPLFIPFIYELIQNQRSNWLLIKLIRISGRLIEKEPRFQKKLIEPYTRLLNQTSSKSLQYELIYSIMKYFKDQQNLYENASELLKQFLNHSDANLRSLGLECLTQIQTSNGLIEFQDQLFDSFKKGDYFYKLQIVSLFKEFTTSKNFDTVMDFFINQSDLESNSKVIEALITIIQKDKFANVIDPERLYLTYIPKIALKIDSISNADKFRDLLFDILARIPELTIYSDLLFKQIMRQFQSSTNYTEGPTLKIVQRNTQLKYSLNHREIIFKTLIMISGEATKQLPLKGLLDLLEFIAESKILPQYENSLLDVDTLLFKIYTSMAKIITDSPNEYQNTQEELEKQVKQNIKSVYNTLHQIDIVCSSLLYETIIFQEKKLEEYSEMTKYFAIEMPPIHADAQKLIKMPDFSIPFQLDLQEIELIKSFNSEKQEQQQQSQQMEQQIQPINQDEELQQLKNDDVQMPKGVEQVKTVKVMKINREEMLPPGVSQQDIKQMQDDE